MSNYEQTGEPKYAILPFTPLHTADQYSSLTRANYHSLKGQAVETVGNLTGAETWQTSGREERLQGDAEYDAARAKGYVEGAGDRIAGKKDNIIGAVTGDRDKQYSGTWIS